MKTYHCGSRQKHALKISILFCLATIILQGCGTLPNGRGWGQGATLIPGWERIRGSAVDAALSPETWAPAMASLALQIDDADKRISDWASDNNPVFGSRENAKDWSDYMETGSGAVYLCTVIAAPSGDNDSDWLIAKSKGLVVGLTAIGVTAGATGVLKKGVGRERPDGSDNKSLPSGHASRTASFTTLARRNLDLMSMSPKSRMFSDISIAGLAIGTGWARVESKAHYPSDILAGYAIGHFVSAFINDAFLGMEDDKAPRLTIEPSRKGMWIGMSWVY